MNLLLKVMLLASGLVLAGCAATSTHESTGQYIDSTGVTTKVKAKLLDNLGVKSLSIKVISYKEEVQLSGFVDSEQVKQRAAQIAATVNNVKKVTNALIVK